MGRRGYKGYSGSTQFEFEVERLKDLKTGEIAFPSGQWMQDGADNFEYLLIPLTVEGQAYFQPGRYFGRPEDCYPDEGEVEIISVVDSDGKDWYPMLSKNERDRIHDEIVENVSSNDYPDYDDNKYDY